VSLAFRVIPTVLCRGRVLVKGSGFNPWRSVGLAAQAVLTHAARGVDEVCLLDVTATPEGRGPDLGLVEELSEALFAPLSVGGGVRGVEDARALLRAGADKVVVCSGGAKAVRQIAQVVGCQAVVGAVDYRADGYVYTHCGRRELAISPVLWARELEAAGAGEILLTSIDREGGLEGYDIKTLMQVAGAVNVPVVAHGGCSGYGDMEKAIKAGASAAAAGALFQFTDATPHGAAAYLLERGIEARV